MDYKEKYEQALEKELDELRQELEKIKNSHE